MLRKIPWPWVLLYATLALFGAASYFKWTGMWGINHLAFLPIGWWIVYWAAVAVVLSLALLRDPTTRLDRAVDAISHWLFEQGVRPRVIIAFAFGAVCWVFRVPTHFLGDGYALLGGLGRGESYILKWTEPGAVLLIRAIQTALGDYTKSTALAAFQGISIISGIGFVLGAFSVARIVDPAPRRRLLAWIAIVFAGTSLLFFGYVEFYPPLWGLMLFHVAFLYRYIENGLNVWPATVILAAACAIHLQCLTLAPGLMCAVWLRHKMRHSTAQDVRFPARSVLFIGVIGVAVFAWLYVTRMEFETIFLPLFTGRPRSPEYAVFSIKHLVDLFNLLIVVCPLALVLCSSALRGKWNALVDWPLAIATVSATCAWLFLLLVDPVLGMGRDWDLFSVAVAPTVILLLLASAKQSPIPSAGFLISAAIVSLLIGTTFITTNLVTHTSETRYHSLLQYYGAKNRSGWSILLNYYTETGKSEARHSVAVEMSRQFPEDTALIKAYDCLDRKDYGGALRLANMLVNLDPYRGDYYQVLGNAQGKLRQYDSAVANYRKAIALIPYQPLIKNELGQVYLSAQRYPEAEALFKQILDFDPSLTMVSEGLALAYYNQSKDDSALQVAQSLFAADSQSPGGHLISMIVDIRRNDLLSARSHYEAYLVSGKSRSDYQGIKQYYAYLMQ